MAKKTPSKRTVETLMHEKTKRKNIPTAEYQSVLQKEEQSPVRVTYERRNRDFVLADRPNRFESPDHADRPVVLAAVNDGVEMGAGEHRWCFRIATLEPTEDVADAVDMNFQSGLAHEMDQHLPAAQFFDRKNQPRHRAPVADADAPNGIQVAHQAALID